MKQYDDPKFELILLTVNQIITASGDDPNDDLDDNEGMSIVIP